MPLAPSPRAPHAKRGLEAPRAEHQRDWELSASALALHPHSPSASTCVDDKTNAWCHTCQSKQTQTVTKAFQPSEIAAHGTQTGSRTVCPSASQPSESSPTNGWVSRWDRRASRASSSVDSSVREPEAELRGMGATGLPPPPPSLFTQGSWVGARCHGAAAGNAHTAPLSPAHTDPSVLPEPCLAPSTNTAPVLVAAGMFPRPQHAPLRARALLHLRAGRNPGMMQTRSSFGSACRDRGDFSRMEDIPLPAPCALGRSCSTVGRSSPSQNWGGAGLGFKTQTGFFTATEIIPQCGKLKMHRTAQQSSRHHPLASKVKPPGSHLGIQQPKAEREGWNLRVHSWQCSAQPLRAALLQPCRGNDALQCGRDPQHSQGQAASPQALQPP